MVDLTVEEAEAARPAALALTGGKTMTHVDNSRWCETHKSYGDHHTDRCPLTFDAKSPEEHQWDMLQQQRKIMGHDPKPYPGDAPEKKRWWRR